MTPRQQPLFYEDVRNPTGTGSRASRDVLEDVHNPTGTGARASRDVSLPASSSQDVNLDIFDIRRRTRTSSLTPMRAPAEPQLDYNNAAVVLNDRLQNIQMPKAKSFLLRRGDGLVDSEVVNGEQAVTTSEVSPQFENGPLLQYTGGPYFNIQPRPPSGRSSSRERPSQTTFERTVSDASRTSDGSRTSRAERPHTGAVYRAPVPVPLEHHRTGSFSSDTSTVRQFPRQTSSGPGMTRQISPGQFGLRFSPPEDMDLQRGEERTPDTRGMSLGLFLPAGFGSPAASPQSFQSFTAERLSATPTNSNSNFALGGDRFSHRSGLTGSPYGSNSNFAMNFAMEVEGGYGAGVSFSGSGGLEGDRGTPVGSFSGSNRGELLTGGVPSADHLLEESRNTYTTIGDMLPRTSTSPLQEHPNENSRVTPPVRVETGELVLQESGRRRRAPQAARSTEMNQASVSESPTRRRSLRLEEDASPEAAHSSTERRGVSESCATRPSVGGSKTSAQNRRRTSPGTSRRSTARALISGQATNDGTLKASRRPGSSSISKMKRTYRKTADYEMPSSEAVYSVDADSCFGSILEHWQRAKDQRRRRPSLASWCRRKVKGPIMDLLRRGRSFRESEGSCLSGILRSMQE
ncbi:unnamed protein product [Amoebophrya sp. A25]|nr:unnamed protein product [Amoebophrya sp. A25]|eukprot:GSA25T00008433001.1